MKIMNPLKDKAREIAKDVVSMGGRAFIVGGFVRDEMLNLNPKDLDLEVFKIQPEDLRSLLNKHGKVDEVGESFQVFKVSFTDMFGLRNELDVSIPREDKKVGEGHKGFEVTGNPDSTIEDAAKRRDFTFNAIMQDALTGEIIDPFNGQADLFNGVLRAVDPKHFGEDPLRVLRGMQFVSRLDLVVEPDTARLMNEVGAEFDTLAVERIEGEFMKAFSKGKRPSRILDFLIATDWIRFFPEIQALVGCEQDSEGHPEGNVITHTGFVMDAAANIADRENLPEFERVVLINAALCHDFGKAITTRVEFKENKGRDCIVSPGHEGKGVPFANSFNERIGMHSSIREAVAALVGTHMRHLPFTDGGTISGIRRLAKAVEPSNIRMLSLLIEADHSGRPPLPKGMPQGALNMLRLAESNQVVERSQKPLLQGKHLLELGLTPSPEFGRIIREVFEMQQEAEVNNLSDAIEAAKKFI